MALKKIRKEYRETPKSEIYEAIYEKFSIWFFRSYNNRIYYS